MNREIKFRCWSKESDNIKTGIKFGMFFSEEENCCCWSTIISEKGAIVMQYTGLKDKNGKEIYEGDIVCEKETVMSDREEIIQNYINIRKDDNFKYSDGTIGKRRYGQQIYIVERDDCSCGFEPFADSKHNCGHCGGGINGNSIEIIGNIYENPELLSPTNPQDGTNSK